MEPSRSGNTDEENTGEDRGETYRQDRGKLLVKTEGNLSSRSRETYRQDRGKLIVKTEGNLSSNWKRFKRAWDNYAIVARLNRFQDNFKTATFLSCVGEDALEIFEGMDFASAEDHSKLNIVVNKFKELCLGETNEIYKRFILNKRQKKENETVDQYVTALRTMAQTCKFLCLFT